MDPIDSESQADISPLSERSVTRSETDGNDDSEFVTMEEFMGQWNGVQAGMAQGVIFYMLPEARRIQERAQQYAKEALSDN